MHASSWEVHLQKFGQVQDLYAAVSSRNRGFPLHETARAGAGDDIGLQGKHLACQIIPDDRRQSGGTEVKEAALATALGTIGEFQQFDSRQAIENPAGFTGDVEIVPQVTGIMVKYPKFTIAA